MRNDFKIKIYTHWVSSPLTLGQVQIQLCCSVALWCCVWWCGQAWQQPRFVCVFTWGYWLIGLSFWAGSSTAKCCVGIVFLGVLKLSFLFFFSRSAISRLFFSSGDRRLCSFSLFLCAGKDFFFCEIRPIEQSQGGLHEVAVCFGGSGLFFKHLIIYDFCFVQL